MNQSNVSEPSQSITVPSDLSAKRQFWQTEIERWQASGKKQVDYSRERGISASQLNYWVAKFRKGDKLSKRAVGKFLPVGMKQGTLSQCIRIKRPNGIWIELPILQDTRQLKNLLELLGC